MFSKCHLILFYLLFQIIIIYAKKSGLKFSSDIEICPKEALIIFNETRRVATTFAPELDTGHVGVNKTSEIDDEDEVICPCLTRTCIPVCCPLGQTVIHGECALNPLINIENWGDIYFPQIYNPDNLQPLNMTRFSYNQLNANPGYYSSHIHVFDHNPCIAKFKYRIFLISQWDDYIKLLQDGSINNKGKYSIHLHNYCLTIKYGSEYNVFYCADTIENHGLNPDYLQWLLSAGARIISLPFLFVTFVVYSTITELKNLHGFILRNYISFLFIADASIASVITCLYYEIYFFREICIAIAFVIHLAFFSSLFWLNVMCFDIWWTFGTSHRLQGMRQQQRKKCILYSIYAWGCALLITGICLIVDFVIQIPSYSLRPQFGLRSCGFMTNTAPSIQFCTPVGIIIICNIILFGLTTKKIIEQNQETSCHLRGIDSRRHDDNEQRFQPCLKLFILMGINWSTEMIPWLFEGVHKYVWYITSLVNALHGVFIFIIFVWKRRIKRSLLIHLGMTVPTPTHPRNSTKRDRDENSSVSIF